MGVDEAGTLKTLRAHRKELIDAKIAEHGGRIVKTMGDGLLLEFPSVVEATLCTVEIQSGMAERNQGVDEDRRITFRIGINQGDVIIEGDDIFGDGVNVAARLQEFAKPGGVAISGRVYDDVRDRLDLRFTDTGEQSLKNIARPIRIWQWSTAGNVTSATAFTEAPLALPDKPSIAVLPFDNMSGDLEQEYFSDGITEDIITELSRSTELFVSARNSSFTYKGRAVKAQQIAVELGVHYVLEGSIRKSGNRVRISAQLIDAVEDRHIWAERYDRELEDIFAVQDEITQNIAGALGVKLFDTLKERALRKLPENLDAYDCMLRSWALLVRFSRESNAEGRRMALRAVELDPNYPGGHVYLAWFSLTDGVFGWCEDPSQAFKSASESARRAVALDQTAFSGHLILGAVYQFSGQQERALEELERSLNLNPNFADTYVHYARVLIELGRADDGLAAVETAMRLNPHYPGWYLQPIASAYIARRQYREAIAPLIRLLDRNPEFATARAQLAVCHELLGETEAARAEIAELLRLNPNYSLAVAARTKSSTLFLDALRRTGLPE